MYTLTCPDCAIEEDGSDHTPGKPGQTYVCPQCEYAWPPPRYSLWEDIAVTTARIAMMLTAGWFAWTIAPDTLWLGIAAMVVTIGLTSILGWLRDWVEDRLDPVEESPQIAATHESTRK